MPILKTGETVTVPVELRILAPFAYKDRIYYITKPVASYADTIWLLTSDGLELNASPELIKRAGRALAQLERV